MRKLAEVSEDAACWHFSQFIRGKMNRSLWSPAYHAGHRGKPLVQCSTT